MGALQHGHQDLGRRRTRAPILPPPAIAKGGAVALLTLLLAAAAPHVARGQNGWTNLWGYFSSPPPPPTYTYLASPPPPPTYSYLASPPPPPQGYSCPTVWQILLNLPNMAATRAAITGAGWVSVLSDPNFQGTLLAPVDQAWGSQVQWWWNPPYILTVLSYHVLPGPGLTTNALAGKSLPTAAGAAAGNLAFNWQYVWSSPYTGSWALNVTGATNSALVVTANLTACNQGVVQVINNVLLPVLTPPVLSPPPAPPSTPRPGPLPYSWPPPSPPPSPSPNPGCNTLYFLVSTTPVLSALKAYVDAVAFPSGLSLAAVLNNPLTRTTLLAPTNTAFQYASPWWASNTQQLAQVLTYHLISGDGRTASQLVTPPGQLFSTASTIGGFLTASQTTVQPTAVVVRGLTNSARITVPDIPACSGSYMQIVDTVLIPFSYTGP